MSSGPSEFCSLNAAAKSKGMHAHGIALSMSFCDTTNYITTLNIYTPLLDSSEEFITCSLKRSNQIQYGTAVTTFAYIASLHHDYIKCFSREHDDRLSLNKKSLHMHRIHVHHGQLTYATLCAYGTARHACRFPPNSV